MDQESELIRLECTSDQFIPPDEIVQERKQYWDKIFNKYDRKFENDEDLRLEELTQYVKTSKLVNIDNFHRSAAYKDYLSAQMDQAIELATLTGNLEPAEDEEDIENEDEESDEDSEEDFLTSERDMLSSPTPGSPRVLVQSPLAGTPRRRHLATPGSPSLVQSPLAGTPRRNLATLGSPSQGKSPIAGITPLISTKKVNRGSPRGLFTSSPRRHTTCSPRETADSNGSDYPSSPLVDRTNLGKRRDASTSVSPKKFIIRLNQETGVRQVRTGELFSENEYEESFDDDRPSHSRPGDTRRSCRTPPASAAEHASPRRSRDERTGADRLSGGFRMCSTCQEQTIYPVDLDLSAISVDQAPFNCDNCLLGSKHQGCDCENCENIDAFATFRWILLDNHPEGK